MSRSRTTGAGRLALRAASPADPPTFVRDVPHGYADPDRVHADLQAAGFGDVDVREVVLESRALAARYGRGPVTAPMAALVVTATRAAATTVPG
ncbi:hypothetical protein F1C76_20520 [Geodermatophilaceae bacterium NBWT11]|nr:hypothetical protein F1C76_20520 [Geodermatophilaceae bacterium NBWT11]